MLTFSVYLFTFSMICYGVVIYRKLASGSVVLATIEKQVATEMEARAHRLCMQAYEAQRIGNTFERIKADEEFQDSLHLYVEDYQSEVAVRLKEHNVSNIAAYGFVRIVK